ncbi:unnamed protein product (macronuclear) [Paramecium tetraurelia]|uniref:Transmembrane protein n=1 Tax=Paramecium tetraurelia TaxID=5888 RepID=A0DMC6_PARTE|nr:uncharacterized protein GSPATT00018411001 [Paramecium tetraurelia]CAK84193.1 unnamed protein product [Paramecium tetraurelia]|eukprot:XP_001451590.1 hypothetical protein (macronuclear) [Paramecium tetraurelia strain d4-2]
MLNQYLKLLHTQWEQTFNDDLSDTLREDPKLSLQNQSIIEFEFISLTKSKVENQWEYENFFNKKREFSFLFQLTYFINAVIQGLLFIYVKLFQVNNNTLIIYYFFHPLKKLLLKSIIGLFGQSTL